MPRLSISGRKRANTNTQSVGIAAKIARRAVISGVVNDVLEWFQRGFLIRILLCCQHRLLIRRLSYKRLKYDAICIFLNNYFNVVFSI